jgi:hypothetical protein
LHSGQKPWTAPEDIFSLVSDAVAGLEPHCPRLRYLLIDERRYDGAGLANDRNLVAMLFRVESCPEPDILLELLRTLAARLKGPELESLRRAFAVWLGRVVYKRVCDEHMSIANELWELPAMLSERFDEWEKGFMEKGRQQALHEMLARLLRKRFGEVPEPVRARLCNASPGQLELWTESLLDAASPDDVFNGTGPLCVPVDR